MPDSWSVEHKQAMEPFLLSEGLKQLKKYIYTFKSFFAYLKYCLSFYTGHHHCKVKRVV